jgi:hypothetical protein
MEPEEKSKFCEHIATLMDEVIHAQPDKMTAVAILFGMLRSPEWRKHIVTRFWRVLAYCTQIPATESVRWCLQNAIELLEFTRELPDKEGLKWWYGTLWFYYDQLDTTSRDEVKRIAMDMLRGDGLSDLNLYLTLMQDEATRIRRAINELSEIARRSAFGRQAQDWLITLGGNYEQLARVTGRR